jgi:hypothetical protein
MFGLAPVYLSKSKNKAIALTSKVDALPLRHHNSAHIIGPFL